MRRRRDFTLVGGAFAAAIVVWACEQPEAPLEPDPAAVLDAGLEPMDEDHDGKPKPPHECPVEKFTGGGRIDPGGEKLTFGFNVHADEDCEPIKGQLQMVHHPTKTKFHSTSITEFSSYAGPGGGVCGMWRGTVRVKHRNGGWHEHPFGVEACDNGEPGSSPGTGPDTFRAQVTGTGPGHGDTRRTRLTGGNIQAH